MTCRHVSHVLRHAFHNLGIFVPAPQIHVEERGGIIRRDHLSENLRENHSLRGKLRIPSGQPSCVGRKGGEGGEWSGGGASVKEENDVYSSVCLSVCLSVRRIVFIFTPVI